MNKYKAYLYGEDFDKLKKRVLKRDNYRCKRCRSTKKLQVHHLTYKRIYNEKLADLITACAICHNDYYHRRGGFIKNLYYSLDFYLSLFTYSSLLISLTLACFV